MQTECIRDMFGFEAVEGRQVVAAFDGGAITSNAGALLLGATDRVIRMVDRLASCFVDRRSQAQVEHSVATLVGQRILAIALGYEDLNDHETLRHDALMAVLAGKLEARRANCAAVAGKSTLKLRCVPFLAIKVLPVLEVPEAPGWLAALAVLLGGLGKLGRDLCDQLYLFLLVAERTQCAPILTDVIVDECPYPKVSPVAGHPPPFRHFLQLLLTFLHAPLCGADTGGQLPDLFFGQRSTCSGSCKIRIQTVIFVSKSISCL
jgi:hypothetical protein